MNKDIIIIIRCLLTGKDDSLYYIKCLSAGIDDYIYYYIRCLPAGKDDFAEGDHISSSITIQIGG